MPGTHRVPELEAALSSLRCGADVDLAVFDKSAHQGGGDVAGGIVPLRGRQDFVLFEGWCVGMPQARPADVVDICRRQRLPLPEPEHLAPVLAEVERYQPLWAFIDFFVMLRPDAPESHEHWRMQQEHELKARTGSGLPEEQVRELVRRFMPWTYLCYETILPDVLVRIDREHRYSLPELRS
jgi:D-glycerate 3-kinase